VDHGASPQLGLGSRSRGGGRLTFRLETRTTGFRWAQRRPPRLGGALCRFSPRTEGLRTLEIQPRAVHGQIPDAWLGAENLEGVQLVQVSFAPVVPRPSRRQRSPLLEHPNSAQPCPPRQRQGSRHWATPDDREFGVADPAVLILASSPFCAYHSRSPDPGNIGLRPPSNIAVFATFIHFIRWDWCGMDSIRVRVHDGAAEWVSGSPPVSHREATETVGVNSFAFHHRTLQVNPRVAEEDLPRSPIRMWSMRHSSSPPRSDSTICRCEHWLGR
jgi:hypothetical protein